MKRSRGDSITGGTQDFSPQILTVAVTMSAANTFTQAQVALPVPKFNTRPNKSIVYEMLKVYSDLPLKDNNFAAAGESSVAQAQISTVSQAAFASTDARTLFFIQKEYRGAFTAAGSYGMVAIEPYTVDLTDGAGHGVLVGSDSIFMGVTTTNFAGAPTFVVKILYRFKEIGLSEYIGIVQSQQ
jgi:hypothetical protein